MGPSSHAFNGRHPQLAVIVAPGQTLCRLYASLLNWFLPVIGLAHAKADDRIHLPRASRGDPRVRSEQAWVSIQHSPADARVGPETSTETWQCTALATWFIQLCLPPPPANAASTSRASMGCVDIPVCPHQM